MDLKEEEGGGVVAGRKSSSEKCPTVDSKTSGEVIMASVIATATQIIKAIKLVNRTDESNTISIMEEMPGVPSRSVLGS